MNSAQLLPRPFLKWAGGKGKLAKLIVSRVGRYSFCRYHEPFLGGGAVFFELYRCGMLEDKEVFLSDINTPLIRTYLAVKRRVEKVIGLLMEHEKNHTRQYFYEIRAQSPSDLAACAARLIYLNKTCFNGLYRENSQGQFNVPLGDYCNPLVCDETNLRACKVALRNTKIEGRSFESVLEVAQRGDFVYFDPPYHPISKTASFTRYSRDGFGEDSQRLLADVFRELSKRGVKALLSNSATDLVRDLYGDFTVEEVLASRNVNSNPEGRGKIAEVLVRNF